MRRTNRFPAMSEQQKVAFVTGASRGLGKACAVEFARAGFRVAVTARTFDADDERKLPGNLQVTADAIAAVGGEALPIRMDLDDRASVTEAVDAVDDQWGRIDVLVNNAFYQTRESQDSLVDMSIEHLDKQIRVNLVAPMFLAKLVLPGMLEHGGGSVLNMVSGAGVHELDVAPGPRELGLRLRHQQDRDDRDRGDARVAVRRPRHPLVQRAAGHRAHRAARGGDRRRQPRRRRLHPARVPRPAPSCGWPPHPRRRR